MLKRLREQYDRLYIAGETFVKACQDRRTLRQYAKYYDYNPVVDQEYKTSIRAYWRQFKVRTPRKIWFYRYCTNHKPFSPKYLPDTLWHRRIIPYFNNLIFAKAWQDKCMHSLFLPGMRRPTTVVKNVAGVFYDDDFRPLTQEEAMAQCHNRGRILVKPSVGSGGGNNIRFYDSENITDQEILDIFRRYKKNFIIQEKAVQHEDLARLSANSLNTVRAVTFFYKGQVHLLKAVLRIGGGSNEVDNISQGGSQCPIRPDGRLEKVGFNHMNGRYQNVETCANGIRFEDVVVPHYDRVVKAVCSQAEKMAHFKISGWDIGVAPDGEPILIEFNVVPILNQETTGPVMGEFSDEVYAEVFGRR